MLVGQDKDFVAGAMLQRMTTQSKLRALAEGAAIVRAELSRPS